VLLTGALCFAASFALFHYVPAVSAWFVPAPSATVSALLATAVAAAAMAVIGLLLSRRLGLHNLRIQVALDNMSQGLCMFDDDERLVLCNRRYLDMYQMPASVAKPGVTRTDLLKYRATHGTFSADIDTYQREINAAMAAGKIVTTEVTTNGRRIAIVNRPMPDGGWVATHEDVTEQRDAERERATMQEQQQRRAAIEQAILAFRQRVEDLLHTVAEGAMAMRTTAATLLKSSGETAKSAESAVTASNEASVNVDTAAIAPQRLRRAVVMTRPPSRRSAGIIRHESGTAKRVRLRDGATDRRAASADARGCPGCR
jgi:hypothetical protein